LIITGEEVTTRNGHWVAAGSGPGQLIDWRYRSRDDVLDQYQDQVHRRRTVCIAGCRRSATATHTAPAT
jgi:hypothetical protein